jgi:hypothetical protein
MKIKITFFAFVMAISLTLPAFAQFTPAPDTVPKPDMKQHDMLSKMSKPTFQATSGDLLFSVWITTQEEHKMMMMEMKKDSGSMMGKGMEVDNATKEAMMAGTHHMVVEVKNNAGGKETKAISAKVEIISPTNKNSSVDLKMPKADHFGSGLTLDEKGEYQFTVSVLVGNISKTIKLKYTVL